MQLAYLYSRYPVLSQTFCDMEMLELERRGLRSDDRFDPSAADQHCGTSMRRGFRSPVYYAPPPAILRALGRKGDRPMDRWPQALVEQHERKYGPTSKQRCGPETHCYFADLFTRHESIEHFHVHFANRAAHTALF